MSSNTLEPLEPRRLMHIGDFDGTFNGGKLLTQTFHEGGSDVESIDVLPDGGLLTTGTQEVIAGVSRGTPVSKYTFDGNPDPTFGNGGTLILAPNYLWYGDQILHTDGGGFIINGETGFDDAPPDTPANLIIKYKADATIDTRFGKDGFLELGNLTDCGKIALDSAGRILVTGREGNSAALRRYLPDGQVDKTFGVDGDFLIAAPAAPRINQHHELTLQTVVFDSNGRIVVSGVDKRYRKEKGFAPQLLGETGIIDRLSPQGRADHSFVTSDAEQLDASAFTNFAAQRVLPDGRIIMADWGRVAELNPDGSLNRAYGVDGVSGVSRPLFSSVAALDDGSVIVPLNGNDPNQSHLAAEFSLRRIQSNGTLDRSFGKNGKVVLSTVAGNNDISGILQQGSDGTIVAASNFGDIGPIDFDPGFVAAADSGGIPADDTVNDPSDTRALSIARLYGTEGPATQLIPRTQRSGSRFLAFTVVIRDNDGVDLSSLGDSNLQLIDADGAARNISFLRADRLSKDKTYVRATYRIAGPGNKPWSKASNGLYQVFLGPNQIRDAKGNASTSGILGTLRVRIA